MKAQLTFDLDDPEDVMRHLQCTKASNMASVLWEFDQWLRSEIKYKNREIEDVREQFGDIMFNNGIILDDIVR